MITPERATELTRTAIQEANARMADERSRFLESNKDEIAELQLGTGTTIDQAIEQAAGRGVTQAQLQFPVGLNRQGDTEFIRRTRCLAAAYENTLAEYREAGFSASLYWLPCKGFYVHLEWEL